MGIQKRAALLFIGFMSLITVLLASVKCVFADQEDKLFVIAAYDSTGEIIQVGAAVFVGEGDVAAVIADASVVSDNAEEYDLFDATDVNKSYPVEYLDGYADISAFLFQDEMPPQSKSVQTGEVVKNEILDVPYITAELGVSCFYVKLTRAEESGENVLLKGTAVDENGGSAEIPSDFGGMYPLGMYNKNGKMVALMTSEGNIYPILDVDVNAFNGSGSGNTNEGDTEHEWDSDVPSGRFEEQPDDTDDDSQPVKIMAIVLASVVILVLAGLILYFILKNKKKTSVSPTPPIPLMPPTPPTLFDGGQSPAVSDYSDTIPAPASIPVSASAQTEIHIMGIAGGMQGRSYPLGNEIVLIGRGETAAIRYPAETKGISRKHCQLYRRGEEVYLMDCGSSYGTFVSGYGRLSPQKPIVVKKGTCFYLGSKQDGFMIQ